MFKHNVCMFEADWADLIAQCTVFIFCSHKGSFLKCLFFFSQSFVQVERVFLERLLFVEDRFYSRHDATLIDSACFCFSFFFFGHFEVPGTYRWVATCCRYCWLEDWAESSRMFGLLRFWMLRICSSVRLKRFRMVRLNGLTTSDCTPSMKKEGSKGVALESPAMVISDRIRTSSRMRLLSHFSPRIALAIFVFCSWSVAKLNVFTRK